MKIDEIGFLIAGLIVGCVLGLFIGVSVCQRIWIQDAIGHKVGGYNGTNGQFELFQYPNQ
jgi:hypothetical protein